MTDTLTLPTEESKAAVEEFIRENNLKDVIIRISPGSKKGDNYIGDMHKIEISSKHDKHIYNLIVKTTSDPSKAEVLKLGDLYNREADLYNIILPIFKKFQNEYKIPTEEQFDFVKCYKANINLILMEDMCAKGYKMNDRHKSYDTDHLELAIKSLARYHSISFAMKKLQPEMYKKLAEMVDESVFYRKYFDPVIERSLSHATTVMTDETKLEKLLIFSKNGVENFHKYVASKSAIPYDIICHGDCWNNNVLFKYENGKPVDMKFVDWQIARACSAITDLSYMIYLSTDAAIRAKYENQLFNIYYDALGKQLTYFGCDVEECYPRAIFQSHLKEFLPYGLLMSTMVIPIMLCDEGNEVNVVEICDANSSVAKNAQYNEKCKERINDVVDEFIKLELI